MATEDAAVEIEFEPIAKCQDGGRSRLGPSLPIKQLHPSEELGRGRRRGKRVIEAAGQRGEPSRNRMWWS